MNLAAHGPMDHPAASVQLSYQQMGFLSAARFLPVFAGRCLAAETRTRGVRDTVLRGNCCVLSSAVLVSWSRRRIKLECCNTQISKYPNYLTCEQINVYILRLSGYFAWSEILLLVAGWWWLVTPGSCGCRLVP